MVIIYALIFIMGLRMGMNEKAIASLETIGFRSLIFSVFTLTFSVVFIVLAEKIFISRRGVDI